MLAHEVEAKQEVFGGFVIAQYTAWNLMSMRNRVLISIPIDG